MQTALKLVVLSALVAAALAVPAFKVGSKTFEKEGDALFQRFKVEHKKAYFDTHDEMYRKSVFAANLEMVRQHNEAAAEGKHTYTMAMNEFGDMTFAEFHAKYTGFHGLRGNFIRSKNTAPVTGVKTADSVDWTTKGAVTDVKNQGQCGSCWAFSTTGSVEGAVAIAGGKLVSLSEQQLMDCSKDEGDNSCEGGLMDYAFEYIIKNGGACSEESYPYQERDNDSCSKCTPVSTISSYTDVEHTEQALMEAVAKGPVSVAIEADQSAFQFYSSGVLTGTCGTQLDHGVLAVGYGTDNGTDYWKVKNSWGASWGMEGYINIERGSTQEGGQCGILLSASYPVV